MSLKGECLLYSELADSNESLRALRGDASDVERPCRSLAALRDRKAAANTPLCYESINPKLVIHLWLQSFPLVRWLCSYCSSRWCCVCVIVIIKTLLIPATHCLFPSVLGLYAYIVFHNVRLAKYSPHPTLLIIKYCP